jgi:putative peptidoglycan lipid II flippase
MSQKKLAKNISIMSVAIFLSRILGLVRDQVMAYFFGAGLLNDAFNVAYNIPNLLRRLFGEGALSTAFVPIYNEIGIKKGKEGQIDFALNLLSILTLFLAVLTLFGIALAPLIVKLLYPGLNPATTEIAIRLTRIIFPYLFFIGMSSTFIAVLNSHDYFFMTGLSSALLNIGMVSTIIIPYKVFGIVGEPLIMWAGWGVIVGGALQTAINLPYLRKVGYKWKLYLSFSSEAITQLWRRFIPSMIGIGIREINLIADSLMASFLPIGSITALGFGNRLMQLPLGIFAISAGTAVLPMYSRHVTNREFGELSQAMRFTALSLAYIMLPVTTLILALGNDFVSILFQSGAKASIMTNQALVFYSLGLVFYSLNQTVTPLFYANKDTRTPMKIAAAMVALNISLNIVLMQFIQHRGLALSTSVTAMVNYIVLVTMIKRKLPDISFSGVLPNLLKTALICIAIFFGIIYAKQLIPVQGRWGLLTRAGILSLSSFVLFYLLGLILHLDYLAATGRNLCTRLRRR